MSATGDWMGEFNFGPNISRGIELVGGRGRIREAPTVREVVGELTVN